MPNIIGTASTTQQLQLEALNEVIKLLIEKEAKLDARISERGSITPVSLRSFRLRFQTAFPGNVSLVQPGRRHSAGRQLQRMGSGYVDPAGHCHPCRVLATG